MSVRRSSAEVERLLRRTYAEVAERTAVSPAAPSGEVRLSPIVPPTRPLARTLLASAAALVLIVGAVVVLANRDTDRPAGLDAPTHVLPGQVPHAEVGEWRPLALAAVQTDNQRDRITYSSNAASITVELDRTRRSLPDGEPIVVRGEPARRTDSTLSWLGPGDALVEVSWSGDVDEATVDTFAQAILYVDDEIWSEVTSTGGFRRGGGSERLTTIRIGADVPFDVDIVGDLHEGLRVQVGSKGISFGYPTGPVVPCFSSTNFETSDPESRVIGYVILARGDATSAVVRAPGADDRSIELTSLLPLVDMSIGGVVYEDRAPGAPDPRVDCEGAS